MLNTTSLMEIYEVVGSGFVPTGSLTCCYSTYTVWHLFTFFLFSHWTRKPSLVFLTLRYHVLCATFLHQTQTCLRCITFPVVCAGPAQDSASATFTTESSRGSEIEEEALSRPATDPPVYSSQKGILHIPHPALLCNTNWFGCQQS